ncbi:MULTISPECIES: YdcF family protein [unclassified Crossiella]|uniref:YdcF family protein n=1 Tax=unclassified Crossiella TaxID=2620835 RepID=UPI001FFF98B1|nr:MULTISPECIES: YdcF family protein [unclassified Crossiella]MCK2240874.1 YdcF family protein [Crossiella sp. S99.2]MCK2253982.1 YdcF family protein [Crossiella sp. S99.1]
MPDALPQDILEDVRILWDYNRIDDQPRRCDVGIGLGSHDLGVADHAAELYHAGYLPLIVFTGANAPTTVDRFPRGEAVHYRERAIELGVPDEAILVEPKARYTGENFELSRALLESHGIEVASVMIVCRPYQQRRAYALCRKMWPEVDVLCSAQQVELVDYLRSIGDDTRVINTITADTQRIVLHGEQGVALPQEMPTEVWAAYERLVAAGYDKRVIKDPA